MKNRKTVKGRIILLQEERFRMKDRQGRSFLLDLSHSLALSAEELSAWIREGSELVVTYEGEPETDTGIAYSIRKAA